MSPRTKPASSARDVDGNVLAPRDTRARPALATANHGRFGPATATTRSIVTVPTACRQRSRVSKPDNGPNRPRTASRSPASSTRNALCSSPAARSRTVRPPASRPSTESATARASVTYCGPAGSSDSRTSSVTVAPRATGAVSGDSSRPWRARCSTAAPSSTHPTVATASAARGRWRTDHATRSPSPAPASIGSAGPGAAVSPMRMPATSAPSRTMGPFTPSPGPSGPRSASRRCRGRRGAGPRS